MDFKHIKGDTFIRNMTFVNWQTPINLTGASIIFSVWFAPVLRKNLEIVSATEGKAKIELTKEEMTVNSWVYSYDLQYTDALWVRTTLMSGSFNIINDV